MPTLHELNIAFSRAAGRLAGEAGNILSRYDVSDAYTLDPEAFRRLRAALDAYDAVQADILEYITPKDAA